MILGGVGGGACSRVVSRHTCDALGVGGEICIYTHMHICKDAHTHISKHATMYLWKYAYMQICSIANKYDLIHNFTYAYLQLGKYACMHICIHANLHLYKFPLI